MPIPYLVFTILVLSVSLTGLRMTIHHFFDFQVSKKLIREYFIFYVVLSLIVIISITYIPDNLYGIIFLVFIAVIFLLEFLLFYKRHFSYESSNKYFLFLIVSNISSAMLIILVITILFFIGALLFG